MIVERIPVLSETSDQLIEVVLDDRPFILRVMWNERCGYFSLSVLEADSTPIVQNIKMVKNFPLVKRFADSRLPTGDLYFIQENGKTIRPEYSELGESYALYYYVPDKTVTTTPVVSSVEIPLIGTIWDSGFSTWDGGMTLWDQ
ncbi:MAG: phage baseplate plug family protein [Shewanella oncorhynchi]